MERLDKIISSQFNISRSIARRDIKRALVSVDNKIIKDFSFGVDPLKSLIEYKGQALSYKKHIYILMNKPEGVLSASNDKNRKTVIDLIPEALSRPNLFPVGRLDKDTTGLLIITDDGEFAHKALSPKSNVFKTYRVFLDGIIPENAVSLFKEGIILADGIKCKSAYLSAISDCVAEIKISEGKYHQIKRMFGVIGLGVNKLERIAFGNLTLPNNLEKGDCKELTLGELSAIFDI